MAIPNTPESVIVVNHKSLVADRVILSKSNPSMRLDDHPVPDTVAIVVKNNPNNPPGFVVLVDKKPVTASSWPLLPNDTISYTEKNTNFIYVGFQGALPPGVTQIIVNYTCESDEE